MPRIARIVVPDCPHHVIQRGNRRQKVFFCDADMILYLQLLKQQGERCGISFLCYCLMENHVHMVAVPKFSWSLTRGLGEAHRKYTTSVNIRENWKGHLWQGRFISYPLDEKHLYYAVRYIEQNPVRAGIVLKAEDYSWSSARAHVYKTDDILVSDGRLFGRIEDWTSFLGEAPGESEIALIRNHELSGRPLGDESFIRKLEKAAGRILSLRKRGRKKGN